jgi:hypothetical protein
MCVQISQDVVAAAAFINLDLVNGAERLSFATKLVILWGSDTSTYTNKLKVKLSLCLTN